VELDLGPELEAFRAEMRDWIAGNRPDGLDTLVDWLIPWGGMSYHLLEEARQHPLHQEWEQKLGASGLICPQWPEEYGGRGWDGARLAIFAEECSRQRVPRVSRGMGEGLVGPSLLVHGTVEQKAYFLPRIVDGRDVYCQGFSEPDHGSDLAGVETRGIVEGDEIIISGQKVWTSDAHKANMMFVLCRTDTEAAKHRGLSFVLCEFSEANNIRVAQLRQMTGGAEFCEDFLDQARAPMFNVVGGLGNGWRVAMTTLGFERGEEAATQHLVYAQQFWDLVETARKLGRHQDPLIRQGLAWAYTHVQVMRAQGLRAMSQLAAGQEPGAEASVNKLFWSEYHKKFGELAVQTVGRESLVRPAGPEYPTTTWQDVFLASRAGTIYSGTSEIQRNIISERALGLPREPRLPAGH
jgi:alkylation response protein AidB-like acyl-CoA dehydrogenase